MKNLALFLVGTFVLNACTVDVGTEGGDRAPSFVYHPVGVMSPFPSDRYLVQDDGTDGEKSENATGYRIGVANYDKVDPALVRFPGISEGLAELDGFGASAEIAIGLTASPALGELVSEELAFLRSVEDASPIKLISIDPKDPQAGKALPFVANFNSDGKTLFIRPWKPLSPQGWYAVVIAKGLRDVTGRPYETNETFAANYAKSAGEGLEGEGYARLKEVLVATPIFALTFRVGSLRTKFEAILDEVRAMSPVAPTYTVTHLPSNHPDLSAIVDGWFQHTNFRDERGKLHDKMIGTAWLRFTVTIPKNTVTHIEPFGLVLGQHGLNNKRQVVLNLSDGLAREGLATVAIDAPAHGSRGPGDNLSYDSLKGAREVLGVWTDGDNITFQAWRFRDIIRQQTLDHLQILRVLKAFPFDITTRTDNIASIPDINASEATYTGQSMGGIIGGVSGGELHELKRVVLNVPGVRLSNILVRNEILGAALIAILSPKTITTSDAYRMIAMAQTVLDPGDPANYVELINAKPKKGMAPRPLLIQASLGDKTLPNFATFDMARVAGAPYVGPYEETLPDLPMQNIPAGGLTGTAPIAFAFYRDIEVDGKEAIADHGNLWYSDTALSRAASFLKSGVIPKP